MHTIGKAARLAGVRPDTLRYYEKAGLIAPERRTQGGYRLYGGEVQRRLGFIREARECGFTLGEIGELLDVQSSGRACCGDIRRRAVEKKLQLEHRIRALQRMSAALGRLIDACAGDDATLDACPILAAFDTASHP